MLLSRIPAIILALLPLATSGPVAPRAACDQVPSWTLTDLKWKSYDTVGQDGTAAFTLTNSVSNKTDALSCKLIANYRCQIKTDDAAEVTIQAQNGILYVWISQDVTCDESTVKHVDGSGDIDLNCDIVQHEDISCTAEPGIIQGSFA